MGDEPASSRNQPPEAHTLKMTKPGRRRRRGSCRCAFVLAEVAARGDRRGVVAPGKASALSGNCFDPAVTSMPIEQTRHGPLATDGWAFRKAPDPDPGDLVPLKKLGRRLATRG